MIDQFSCEKRVINRKHCEAASRASREAVALISGPHTIPWRSENTKQFSLPLSLSKVFSSTSVVPLSNRASSGVQATEAVNGALKHQNQTCRRINHPLEWNENFFLFSSALRERRKIKKAFFDFDRNVISTATNSTVWWKRCISRWW